MAAITNEEFAKTLGFAPHLQEQAAAFADAKGLSLAARDVVAEERQGKLMLIVTADAALALALNAGRNFAPICSQFTADGKEWLDVWLEKTPPAACRVTFEVDGIEAPVRVTHTWAEYTQGRTTHTQKSMPSLMLAKATMQLGLRRIAPQALAGLYSPEEAEAAESGAIAQAEHAAEMKEVLTPEVDKESKGTTLTRGEQWASRKAELVAAGKGLRNDFGQEAAAELHAVIKTRGADPEKLSAAHLKAILEAAAHIRAKASTPEPEPEPEPASEPDTASKGSHAEAKAAWDEIGGDAAPAADEELFVI